MSKTWKAFLTGLAVIGIVLIPACRTTKKQVKDDHTTMAMDTTPTVPVVVATAPTTVAPNNDFVKTDTDTVTEAPLPSLAVTNGMVALPSMAGGAILTTRARCGSAGVSATG